MEEQLCLEHGLLTESFKISKVIYVDKICNYLGKTWGTLLVAQLVEAPRYKSEVCRFDSRWCHWNFSLT
jgi:hypothetical protein